MTPDRIEDEAELDRILTEPSPALIKFIRTVSSPLMLLGAGGKMGSTVAVLAHRAAQAAGHPLEVIAASRFSDQAVQHQIEQHGVGTQRVDLLERESVRELPDAENVISLVGLKFGTSANPSLTWAVNTLAPANSIERYPSARWVALSTGNVYPLVSVDSGGATETEPQTPLGEYANAAVARERLFEYMSRRHETKLALLRLNYAVELRYGVLVDLACKIESGETVALSNGWFNCIWQGDASEMILRALALATHPPAVFNLCCPAIYSVREVATKLAKLLDRPVTFAGEEAPTALLSNPAKLCAQLGHPPTPLDIVLRWTADWVRKGGRTLNRPTRFEVRDGRY